MSAWGDGQLYHWHPGTPNGVPGFLQPKALPFGYTVPGAYGCCEGGELGR